MEHPGAVAFGKTLPEFWVQTPIDRQPASVGNGVSFSALSQTARKPYARFTTLPSLQAPERRERRELDPITANHITVVSSVIRTGTKSKRLSGISS
jgi:hypothetical protein